MPKLNGQLSGIRQSLIEEIEALFDYPVEKDCFLPPDLAARLAQYTARVNREIAMYISRRGEVLDLVVGEGDQVSLSDLRRRRDLEALSRVRLIHTHPGGDARLSDVDLVALKNLWLDAICAIGVDENGSVTGVSAAFLGEKRQGIPTPVETPVYPLDRIPQTLWMLEIARAEEAVKRGEEKPGDRAERAILVGIDNRRSLTELAALADTAGAQVVGSLLQTKTKPDPATFIGTGKAGELALEAQALEADIIIVDDELTGGQTERLSALVGLPVIDRTTLILDIFAKHATSAEGKLQVALAQLKYRSRHLMGQGLMMSRLAGGIGTRGPGESKLEIDRRRIRESVTKLKEELKQLEKQRDVRRKSRTKSAVPVVVLVGYTNAGKSTLLNALTDAGVYAQDKLFATLDAVGRQMVLPNGQSIVLVDSVGFINKLPTDLIEAFRSTLEEAALADLLLIINDASSDQLVQEHAVVDEVLEKIGAGDRPRIEVLNKTDLCRDTCGFPVGAIAISAQSGEGLDTLLHKIEESLAQREQNYDILIPFNQYAALSDLRKNGRILAETHEETGSRVSFLATQAAMGRLNAKYPAVFSGES